MMLSGKGKGSIAIVAGFSLAMCILLASIASGCGRRSDPYQGSLEMKQALYELYGQLDESISFLKSLGTIDVKGNPDVFNELAAALDNSKSACENARAKMEEIKDIPSKSSLSDFEGPIQELGEEVEELLVETEEVVLYLHELDKALQPWKEQMVKMQESGDVNVSLGDEIDPEFISRTNAFLATRDSVISGLVLEGAPSSVQDLHANLVASIEKYYRDAEALLYILMYPEKASISFAAGPVDEGSGFLQALEALKQKLDVRSRIDEAAGPIEDLLFDYLSKYRPEQDE